MFEVLNLLCGMIGMNKRTANHEDASIIRNVSAVASPLNKYIYLSNWGAAEKQRFIATCGKNFLVYIVTIETDGVEESAGQRALDTPRDCNRMQLAEDLCGALIPEGRNILDSASDKSSYRSKIVRSRNTHQRAHTLLSLKDSNSKLSRFIKKIMPAKSTRKVESSASDEMFLRDFNFNEADRAGSPVAMEGPTRRYMQNFISPIYLEHNIVGEFTQAETLHEINELNLRIERSEENTKELLLKYIQDKDFEKDLSNAVINHNRLLGEIEKRTMSMTNEHWMQQVEVYKEQQKTMQLSINNIIHQNRELLEENEQLVKKNEKLHSVIVNLKATCAITSRTSTAKSSKTSSRVALDDMSRNNDRLRTKISSIMNRVGDLEEVIKKMQKRTHFLQQQLNSANSQLYDSKVLLEKSKADHELHTAKLMSELQSSNSVLRECGDNGNMIMQDMEMLKMQLQPIVKSFNWSKFQKGTRTLPEIMHLNRAFISELTNELISKNNELIEARREIDNLKLAESRVKPYKEEIQELRSKLGDSNKQSTEYEVEIRRLKEVIAANEEKISGISSFVTEKDLELDTKDKMIRDRDELVETLKENADITRADCNALKCAADKLEHENNSLQMQLQGMAQVLSATGAGDIAKELANTQDKLTTVQTKYFALAAENNIMLKQLETNKNERQQLVAYQKNCYEQLQTLHKEIDTLEKSQTVLRDQLDAEKSTVSALQTERVRHLEERTILTAIYERLKSEISKVDQLEGTVSTMNKKASRLAMIAEYNKQLGEKLQLEVAERDVAINQLQNNVKQLNSFQMESSKEKVALCEELNKVFSVKEVLNTKLTAELEKNVMLDESKKEIQNNANLQLKEIQDAYYREHAALKNLVQDVKKLVAERDALAEGNKGLESKCIKLMVEQEKLVDYIKSLQTSVKEKEERLSDIEELLEKRTKALESLKESSENDIQYLRSHYEEVANQMENVTKENEKFKSSMDYIKADLTKVRQDLEYARQRENEYKKILEELKNRCAELDKECEMKSRALQEILEENEILKINAYSITEKLKSLSEEKEQVTTHSFQTEMIEKYQSSRGNGLQTPVHVENIIRDLNARDEEIIVLQDRIREFEERFMEMNDLLQTISENKNTLEMRNNALQNELEKMVNELQTSRKHQAELECIIDDMRNTHMPMDDMQDESHQYKTALEQLKLEYSQKFQEIACEMNALEQQKDGHELMLVQKNETVLKYKEAHEKLQKAHRLLAVKLFTAVRVLICEKVSLETAQSKVKALTEERDQLLAHKEQTQIELHHYQSQAEDFKLQLHKAMAENSAILSDVNTAKQMINELERQLEDSTKMKAHGLEETVKEQETHIVSIKLQLEESRKNCSRLQEIISNLEAACARFEVEKSEAILRLHELQAKTDSEVKHNDEMKHVLKTALGLVLSMKERGLISTYAHKELIQTFSEHLQSFPNIP